MHKYCKGPVADNNANANGDTVSTSRAMKKKEVFVALKTDPDIFFYPNSESGFYECTGPTSKRNVR
ncbi:14812_t:CDS:2 [Acaulospora morrowiae]|uniref:14812_t:CDS:1 n=1 Tax=Acaulospora morrowiae TaxID=94023 RepID=A0A9N9AG15_9GLOM|nr:14812_t:CDS:2 [Acaulospora morrowiae]